MKKHMFLIAALALLFCASQVLAQAGGGGRRGGAGGGRDAAAGGAGGGAGRDGAAGGAGRGGFRPGGGDAAGGRGGPGGGPLGGLANQWQPRTPLDECVSTLIELICLHPNFTLTTEQKQQIQTIRDEFARNLKETRELNREEMRKIDTDLREAFRGGDRDKIAALRKKRDDLRATEPKPEDAVKKIKAVLNADQLKVLEAKLKEIEDARKAAEDENRARWEDLRQRFGGGRGADGAGGAGGGGGGAAPPPVRPPAPVD